MNTYQLLDDSNDPILKQLDGCNIVAIELVDGNELLEINERCDDYYGCCLTKKQTAKLIAELCVLFNQMS